MRAFLFTFFISVLFSSGIFAQELTTINNDEVSIDEIEAVENSGIFSNTKSLFIDFENLDNLPTNIRVLNNRKEVVFSENLLDLPEDSIYEFDLLNLEKGVYSLQIQTYKHTINQMIDIN